MAMADFWSTCGHRQLRRDAQGWLVPGDDWLRLALARPELAPVAESCAAERALHQALNDDPARVVGVAQLEAIADSDARENYALFLRFRDALLGAGTLESWYLQTMRAGRIDVPPLFIDWVVQCIVRELLDDSNDAFEARAGEMLFRRQRISAEGGQLIAGDAATLDLLNDGAGLGDIGRTLAQIGVPLRAHTLQVLGSDNGAEYFSTGARHDFLLDLSHENTQDLGHGLAIKLVRARSGLGALARVLQRWVRRLLGVQVRITPVARIDDTDWRWHLGLDVESSALLNDLYRGHPVGEERMQRLISLFRLEFADPAEMSADLAGRPVHLGLAMDASGLLRLKPQNLLLNLPLAAAA
jgi:hypothetical protein